MKFTNIDQTDTRPGRLTVWRPTPPVGEGEGWVSDTRAASYAQEAHITRALSQITWALARSGGGGGAVERGAPAWLATAFELPCHGDGDADALESALLTWIDRHESLRSRLVPAEWVSDGPHSDTGGDRENGRDNASRGGRIKRITLRPGAVALRRSVVGDFSSGAEVAARIEDLFDAETNPLTWPSFVFATVEHTDSTTLFLGFDHSNVDGYSILLIAHEIRELFAAALTGVPAPLSQVGSYLDFADTERGNAARIHNEHETVVRWRDFLTTGGGELPVFPTLFGEVPGAVPAEPTVQATTGNHPRAQAQISGCEWLLDAETARAFQKACGRRGGNFLTGVLACLALASRELAGAEEFRALTPFHTRKDSQWVSSVGWYVGLAPLWFPVGETDGFTDLLPGASAALDGADEMAAIPLARVSELLGTQLEPRYVVSYMDMRRTPGAREWGAWKAAALRCHSMHPDEVYLWINRSYEGVYLSFRHPRTESARVAVSQFVVETARQMNLVALESTRQQEPAPAGAASPVRVSAPIPAAVPEPTRGPALASAPGPAPAPTAALEGPWNQEMEPTAC